MVGDLDAVDAVFDGERVSSAVAMPLRMKGILNFLRNRATSAQEKRAWKLSLWGARRAVVT